MTRPGRAAGVARAAGAAGAVRAAGAGPAVLAAWLVLVAGSSSAVAAAERPAPVPGSTSGRPALTARDVVLDTGPGAGVLALWRHGDRSPASARRLATALPYRTIQEHLARTSGCVTTVYELSRALANPDSGACGFGLHPAWTARGAADSLVRAVRLQRGAMAARIAARSGAYLPRAAAGERRIRFWFLFGSQHTFDAITLDADADGDSSAVVIVNLVDVLGYGPDTRSRMAVLEHVLTHEAVHAGLRRVQRASEGWRDFRERPRTALTHIANVMVDEGVAHYVDWKDRPGSDTLFTTAPGRRETFAFSQLALACRRLAGSRPGSAQWEEVLQLASTGPLWSKYGAISGMFAASRIERALGREALVTAAGEGPVAFLRRYREVAVADSGLRPLPAELTELK